MKGSNMAKVIGLTGSIGTGKSSISDYCRQRGIIVVDADEVVRQLYLTEEFCREMVLQFGREILDREGKIDRKRLADRVFKNETLREKLNRLIHPIVREKFLEAKERYREEELLFFDIPLLFETGMDILVDIKVVVTADEEKTIERIVSRDGRTRGEAERILSSQLSQYDKISKADYVIENNGSLQELYQKVDELIEGIKRKEI